MGGTFKGSTLHFFMALLLFTESSRGQFHGNSSSIFVDRCRKDCAVKKDGVVCGKYRVVRWLQDIAREKEFVYGPLKIIKIPPIRGERMLPQLSQPRWFKAGMDETLTFVRDVAEDLLTRRALVYTIDHSAGARDFATAPLVLDEDELSQVEKGRTADLRIFHKKKKALLFPIVILIEIFKLKLMLIPIFLGVHFIKKILVVGSLVLPALLTKLKICKVGQHPPPHFWATAAESPVDYPTGYGHEEASWPHRSDVQGHYGGYSNYHNPYNNYMQGG